MPTRRERTQKATLREIHACARRLLVTQGSSAVTINAVARELGVSGPALYHYFTGHDELVGALTADFFDELAAAMRAARDADTDEPTGHRILAVCRAMRAWATSHPAEFGWVFARPIPSPDRERTSVRHQAAQRFEDVLLDLTVELWRTRPFPVPALDSLPVSLREQLVAYSAGIDGRLPPEAAHVFLSCWVRLYGLLCMEVLHQLDFAFADAEPLFEECLTELADKMGITT